MPRVKGQSNSYDCRYCAQKGETNRVIARNYYIYNFNTHAPQGPQGHHTCSFMYAADNTKTGIKMGQRFVPNISVTSEPTTEPVEPTTEPITNSIQEPTNMSNNNFDFGGFIQGIVQNEMVELTTKQADTAGVLNNLVETIKAAAAEAARAVTPTTHEYTVTVNGAVVHQAAGRPHFKMDRVVKSLARRKHVWLVGPAGSGKTTAASMAAEMLGMRYSEMSLGPASSQWDLNGFKNANGDYVPGEMRDTYENGGVFMLDEIDNANPSVLVAINAALGGTHGNFPDGRVKKHKDFVCIAGANTFGRGADRMYVGRTQIDATTIDRFKFLPFDYDEEAELDWAGHDQSRWVEFVQKVRHAAMERGLRVIVSPRASINGADELRDDEDWNNVADEWIWNKMSAEDAEMLKLAIRN
jgi:energy-coupling factor transporter ATP-binding protein EcfA2